MEILKLNPSDSIIKDLIENQILGENNVDIILNNVIIKDTLIENQKLLDNQQENLGVKPELTEIADETIMITISGDAVIEPDNTQPSPKDGSTTNPPLEIIPEINLQEDKSDPASITEKDNPVESVDKKAKKILEEKKKLDDKIEEEKKKLDDKIEEEKKKLEEKKLKDKNKQEEEKKKLEEKILEEKKKLEEKILEEKKKLEEKIEEERKKLEEDDDDDDDDDR